MIKSGISCFKNKAFQTFFYEFPKSDSSTTKKQFEENQREYFKAFVCESCVVRVFPKGDYFADIFSHRDNLGNGMWNHPVHTTVR